MLRIIIRILLAMSILFFGLFFYVVVQKLIGSGIILVLINTLNVGIVLLILWGKISNKIASFILLGCVIATISLYLIVFSLPEPVPEEIQDSPQVLGTISTPEPSTQSKPTLDPELLDMKLKEALAPYKSNTYLGIEKCKMQSENIDLSEENIRFSQVYNEMIKQGYQFTNEQTKQMFKDNSQNYKNKIYQDCLESIN